MKKIIYANDKAYQLIRTIRQDQLKNPNMEDLKKFFHCDTLLRKQGVLYFCRLIKDIEYEEINIWYVLRWRDQCRDNREIVRRVRKK